MVLFFFGEVSARFGRGFGDPIFKIPTKRKSKRKRNQKRKPGNLRKGREASRVGCLPGCVFGFVFVLIYAQFEFSHFCSTFFARQCGMGTAR